MIHPVESPEADSSIANACAEFAGQTTSVLPMDGMAIVLLEPEGDTSRVVFTWANPSISWTAMSESTGLPSMREQTRRPALRISLNGQEGLLGEVLIRGCGPGVYSSSRRELVGQFADHLALALENTRLRRSLSRKR